MSGSTDLRGVAMLRVKLQQVRAGVLVQKQQMTDKIAAVVRDYNADKTSLFFHLLPSKSPTFCGDCCLDGMKSEPPFNADGSIRTATTCS
jgi:hypothetical protein